MLEPISAEGKLLPAQGAAWEHAPKAVWFDGGGAAGLVCIAESPQ